jgi:hypothetical protein
MPDNEVKETLATMLARIEERIKLGFTTNDKEHTDIKTNQTKLLDHVNHREELMSSRIASLENTRTVNEAEKKGAINVWKVSTAILALATTILTLAKILGYI